MPTRLDRETIIAQLEATIRGLHQIGENREFAQQKLSFNVASARAAIERFTAANSPHRKNLNALMETAEMAKYGWLANASEVLTGQLTALKIDYENGYLETVEDLIQANLFVDFMEMAEHLLEEGYHIPAAVMIGGVLEESLRKLCVNAEIPLTYTTREGDEAPRKASQLNDELKKAEVYNNTVHKQVTAWQGLRNDAAHGDYDKFSLEEIRLMYHGVMNFLNQHTG